METFYIILFVPTHNNIELLGDSLSVFFPKTPNYVLCISGVSPKHIDGVSFKDLSGVDAPSYVASLDRNANVIVKTLSPTEVMCEPIDTCQLESLTESSLVKVFKDASVVDLDSAHGFSIPQAMHNGRCLVKCINKKEYLSRKEWTGEMKLVRASKYAAMARCDETSSAICVLIPENRSHFRDPIKFRDFTDRLPLVEQIGAKGLSVSQTPIPNGKYIDANVIFCFWTGTTPMSENRKRCFMAMSRVSECNVVLVTPSNLQEYVVDGHPIHKSYDFLSETQKSDYLRCYFMKHHGGGYCDIKNPTASWKQAFRDISSDPTKWINGYPEVMHNGVAYEPLVGQAKLLIGNGAYISKPNNPIIDEVYSDMNSFLDSKYPELLRNPAIHPRDSKEKRPAYPIEWNEVHNRRFHRVVYKHLGNLLRTVPMPDCKNYL